MKSTIIASNLSSNNIIIGKNCYIDGNNITGTVTIPVQPVEKKKMVCDCCGAPLVPFINHFRCEYCGMIYK